MAKRPSVQLNCHADQYHAPNERIVEFNANDGSGKGGLISFCIIDGRLRIALYRMSEGVMVDLDQEYIRRVDHRLLG